MNIKCFFGNHEYTEELYDIYNGQYTGSSICECGGYKMFHDWNEPHGNCGNFRPYKNLKVECKKCGHRDKDKEREYSIFRQCSILGVK